MYTKILNPKLHSGNISTLAPHGENWRVDAGGRLLSEMKQALQEIGDGYVLHTWDLLASDYGLPQKRNRIFFCGIRKDLSEPKNIMVPPVVDLRTAKYPTTSVSKITPNS